MLAQLCCSRRSCQPGTRHPCPLVLGVLLRSPSPRGQRSAQSRGPGGAWGGCTPSPWPAQGAHRAGTAEPVGPQADPPCSSSPWTGLASAADGSGVAGLSPLGSSPLCEPHRWPGGSTSHGEGLQNRPAAPGRGWLPGMRGLSSAALQKTLPEQQVVKSRLRPTAPIWQGRLWPGLCHSTGPSPPCTH